MVVKGEDFVVGGGGSKSSMALFFLNFSFISFSFHWMFFSILYSFLIRKSSQMLLNQTDVAVGHHNY